jgi:hypothetical protein
VNAIPQAHFVQPPDETSMLSAHKYALAIAGVVQEAARQEIIPPRFTDAMSKGKPRDLTDFGCALWLVEQITRDDRDRQRWFRVQPLQDEIGVCVAHLRMMQRAEQVAAYGAELLESLRTRIMPAPTPVELAEPAGSDLPAVAAVTS